MYLLLQANNDNIAWTHELQACCQLGKGWLVLIEPWNSRNNNYYNTQILLQNKAWTGFGNPDLLDAKDTLQTLFKIHSSNMWLSSINIIYIWLYTHIMTNSHLTRYELNWLSIMHQHSDPDLCVPRVTPFKLCFNLQLIYINQHHIYIQIYTHHLLPYNQPT